MTTFICVFEPTIEARTNGAVPLTIAFNAANIKIAAATAMIKLSEAYPESMDNFDIDEPILCEDAVGSPRPPLDQFDEKFAIENEFDGKKWQPIKYKEFKKLATRPRVAALLLFGKTQITDKEYTSTLKYLNESVEDPKVRNIATGLAEITKVSLMDADESMEIAQAVYEHADADITIEDAKALGESWLTDEPKVEIVEDEPVLKRDYAMLDMEIALALSGNVDISNVKGSDVRKAKELISADNKVWKRLSMDLRTYPSVLNIPRETIFALVTEVQSHPELFDDANARIAFINGKLGTTEPKVTSLGNGRFSIDNLETKPANDEITATELTAKEELVVSPEKPKRNTKKKETLAKVEEVPSKEITVEVIKEPEIVTIAPVEVIVQQDDFKQRADVLDEVLKVDNDNANIWKKAQRTDPRFTKDNSSGGYKSTSIDSYYMFMRATEIFGSVGDGWGYEVMEEKMIDGNPLVDSVLNEKNEQVAVRFLRDNDGKLIFEQNHSIKIKFWYITSKGSRAEFESYGATVYRNRTVGNKLKSDGEALKKSLTDAIKKALSMLGFSSDVFMGMYDSPEYVATNKLEYEIKAATESAEDVTRVRKELDEKFTRHTETMRSAVTANELRGITSNLTREISTHAKLAKERGDKEYEKYLTGRLRRLNEIESECLDHINQKEEAI